MVKAARATAPPSSHHFLTGRTAIRIARNSPESNARGFSHRPKRACFGAHFAAHNSPLATQKSAIASAHPLFSPLLVATQRFEIKLTRSQQTRKHFLIATIFGNFAPALYFTNRGSRIAPFLFDTNERMRKNLTYLQPTRKQFLFDTSARSFAYPAAFRDSPIPSRHGRIAAL
jgi:hypothetical protein